MPPTKGLSSLFKSNIQQPLMELVAAIDQGTSSSRVFLFDKGALPVSSYQAEFKTIYQKAGWCEQLPHEVVDKVKLCLDESYKLAQKQYKNIKIVAVGFTNQRETSVVWDKRTGKALHNAIVWNDNRTEQLCDEYIQTLQGNKDGLRKQTGLPISSYFSAIKVQWILRNSPEARKVYDEGNLAFGTMDSWIVYNLTGGINQGVHITDVTNACRTLLASIDKLEWSPDLIKFFSLEKLILPAIRSSAEIYGYFQEGLYKGTPIASILGDSHASLFGQRCLEGQGKCTYGTGLFLMYNTGNNIIESQNGLLTTVAYKLGDRPIQYALEGAVGVGGAAIGWLRDQLQIIKSTAEVEECVSQVQDSGGVYFVPAFGGLLAPRWRTDARGAIVGITAYTNKNHILRAALEALAFQAKDVIEAMYKDLKSSKESNLDQNFLNQLKCDGGATKNDILLQIQADFIQRKVSRPQFSESSVLGAALAAGLAVNFYDEALVFTQDYESTEFNPIMESDECEKRYKRWQIAVDRTLNLNQLDPFKL